MSELKQIPRLQRPPPSRRGLFPARAPLPTTSARPSPFLPLLLALLAACGKGSVPSAPPPSAPAGEREARIVAVLKFKVPQLAPLDVRLEPIQPGEIPGLEEAQLVVRGGRPVKLYLSKNDRVFGLLPEPIDASRPVAVLRAERLAEANAAAKGQPARGNPAAPVTVIEFSDFQCPYCKRAAGEVAAVLGRRGGQVRFIYRHFPLDFHPWAMPAAIAAQCAAAQKPEAFWALHDAYFAQQGEITPDNVVDRGAQALAKSGIDLKRWRACAGDGGSPDRQAAMREVEASLKLGSRFGVDGTPGFLINGRFISGVIPAADLESLVDEALAGK